MSTAEKDSIFSRAQKPEVWSILGAILILVFLIGISVSLALKYQQSGSSDDDGLAIEEGALDIVDKNSLSLDEITTQLQESYDEDLQTDEGFQVFVNYVSDQAYDGAITFNRAYEYLDEMGARVEAGRSKIVYCSEYAKVYYELNRDINEAVVVFQKCQPEAEVDPQILFEYYGTISSLYEMGGNTTQAEHYNSLAAQTAPAMTNTEEAYGIEE